MKSERLEFVPEQSLIIRDIDAVNLLVKINEPFNCLNQTNLIKQRKTKNKIYIVLFIFFI